MRDLPRRFAVLLLLTSFSLPLPAAAEVILVVNDTTFEESEWETNKAPNPNQCLIFFDPAGTTICGQGTNEPSSDGDARSFTGNSEIIQEGGLTTGLIAGAHVMPNRAYSPSASGAIESVAGGFFFRAGRATEGTPSTIEAHLLIEQAGSTYISFPSVSAMSDDEPSDFLPFSVSGLEADDFREVSLGGIDPSSHPDFSASAPDLLFGFAVDLSWDLLLDGPFPPRPGISDFLNRSFRIDEYQVSVTTQSATPPVPANGPLVRAVLVAGLLLLGAFVAQRTRRHRATTPP